MSVTRVTIGELSQLKYAFFIPAYQRGYRRTESEVNALLEDIASFTPRVTGPDADQYCLQPLTLQKCESPADEGQDYTH